MWWDWTGNQSSQGMDTGVDDWTGWRKRRGEWTGQDIKLIAKGSDSTRLGGSILNEAIEGTFADSVIFRR